MNMQDIENQVATYCQELGFLVMNAKKMNARIAFLEAEIERLDHAAGELKKQNKKQEGSDERPNN